MFKKLTFKNYKLHTTWGMHKHNPSVLLIHKPTGHLVSFLDLPTPQQRHYIEVCGVYVVRRQDKAAS